jgi:DNA processing protein
MKPDHPAETNALLTLHLVPGLGPRLTAALLQKFGSATAALRASAAQLQDVPYVGAKLAGELAEAVGRVNIEKELEQLDRHGVRLLALGNPDYPTALAPIPDPPHLLYMRGALGPADAKAVALVGSRNCSSYGKRITERLATGLARAGYTIVSGLARGIDGVAHRAALQAGGRTLGVLAGGLSRIYPPEHADLAREIEASGALLSEATMDQEPLPAMFPARNRIISGLCRGVVVIEAADRSGALLTATHAGDQGRPVMAVPGPVDHASSGGTNALIRKGAVLVRGPEDVLEELEGLPGMQSPEPAAPPPALDETQRRIWDFLGEGPRHLDEMVQALGIEAGPLSGKLLMLEMKKAVRRLPGNRFERS